MFPCYPHSSSGGVKMFAFTSSQWEEFQRQALIYKYIIRCVPVPSHLLFPSTPAVYFSGGGSMDPEPGRCRRTDGKKWRCAKDAAPEQKYCEKHLIRNRPRSRKLVEQRKTKHKSSAGSSSTNAEDSVENIKTAIELNDSVQTNNFGEEKGYREWAKSSYSETQASDKQPDALYSSINTGLKFNTIGAHSVMQRYTELPNLNYNDTNNVWNPFIHSTGSADCDKPAQTYFDAWSTENNSANLPLPTLSLSIPTAIVEDSTQDMKSHQLYNWMGLDSTVGGPLAEVLHSSNLTSHESSPRESFVSSPSGVLQKAIATLSDSSGSSSPTFVGRWMNLNK